MTNAGATTGDVPFDLQSAFADADAEVAKIDVAVSYHYLAESDAVYRYFPIHTLRILTRMTCAGTRNEGVHA